VESLSLGPAPNKDLNRDPDRDPDQGLHPVQKIEEEGGLGNPIETKEKRKL
jgi:hypothetical protein